MELKDKIIMVHYIGFGPNVNQERLPHYIKNYAESMNRNWAGFTDVMNVYVPNLINKETRLECLNPTLYTEEKFKEIQILIEKMENDKNSAMKEVMDNFNKSLESKK